MPLRLEVISTDPAVREKRKEAADRTLEKFADKLPDLTLLVFLDDRDDPDVKRVYGTARGVAGPIRANSPTIRWLVDPTSGAERNPRDDYGIYLHDSTCSDEVALTMTLAHELQHFFQYGFKRRLWAESNLIHMLPWEIQKREHLNWPDIPHEREARIVAKYVASEICGRGAVESYIDRLISETHKRCSDGIVGKDQTLMELDDLKFSRELASSSVDYDLGAGVRALFQRLRPYRHELEDALRRKKDCRDYKSVDLSRYFDVP
jgi:hypothetical protein